MPICHKKKFIFFHIPRCGGTSFSSLFDYKNKQQLWGVTKSGDQIITLHHLTATDLKQANLISDEILNSYFKFTIIRDPFDRMASDFIWQKYHDPNGIFSAMTFQDYLNFGEKILDEGRYFEKRHFDHFRPMTLYCLNGTEPIVDDILLLERIDQDIKRIQQHIGQIEMPKFNSSHSYAELKTTSNLDHVYKLYEADKILYDHIAALENEITQPENEDDLVFVLLRTQYENLLITS